MKTMKDNPPYKKFDKERWLKSEKSMWEDING